MTQAVEDGNLVVSVTYRYFDRDGKEVLKMLRFVAQNPKQWQQYQATLLAVRAEASPLA